MGRVRRLFALAVDLNDTYGLIQTLQSWKGLMSLLVSLIVSIGASIKHYDWPVIVVLGLLTFIAVMVVFLFIWPALREHFSRDLDILIRPTSGPSPTISLIVTNTGKSVSIAAFCRIVANPNGVNPYRHGEYRCGWGDGTEDRKIIGRGESANLLIAAYVETGQPYLSEMQLLEAVGGKSVRWDSCRWNQFPNEQLPAYDLKIRFVGEETKEREPYLCTLKPDRYTGPLKIVKTEAVNDFQTV